MSEAETAKFDGLLQRVRTALILLPFVIAPVVFGGWSFALLLAIVGFLMAREWTGLLMASETDGNMLGGVTVALMAFGWTQSATDAIAVLVVGSLAIAAVELAKGRRLTPLVGGLYYVTLPLLTALLFREDALGAFIIGYILLSVWAVDIFAMFSGKLIGGPKLAPVISPKKTWAGLAGAIVGAMLAATLSFLTLVGFGFGQMNYTAVMIMAPFLAVFAQAADLFESAIKRKYDLKDSSSIMPGHGGLLDRVDGLIGVLLALLLLVLWRGGSAANAIWVW